MSDSVLGAHALALIQTSAYLRDLPSGLDSYPACVAKASVYRAFLDATDLSKVRDKLPPAARELVDRPLVHSSWVSEVRSTVLYLAARDLVFTSDEAFIDHFRVVNRQLISSPAYRVLFGLVGPRLLLQTLPRRFAALHRGVTVSGEAAGNSGELLIEHPAHLIPRLIGRCYLTGLEVAVEAAGGKAPKAQLANFRPDRSLLTVTWSDG